MTEYKTKNKDSNTFRFCSFAQRIKEIDLRHLALYHVGHINEELPVDVTATYFHQTLIKWMSLNLSEEFAQFSRRVVQVVSLPQLLHQKQFVIDELLEYLSKASSLSMQSLLELLYILAKDLREEFYPYFQRTLKCLISLLNTQDAEQLEWCFVCLAHLFKLLKPYLKRNIGVVFHCILPLLDEQQYDEYISNFAVECFSFIARNVRDYGKFLDFILSTLVSTQVESLQACGRLLFEMMRGVPGQFHSTAGDFLQFIFEQLAANETQRPQQQTDLLNHIVSNAIQHLLNFITPQQMTVFWTQLCLACDKTQCLLRLTNLIKIFQQVIDYRDGKYLTDVNLVIPCILRMLDHCMLAEDAIESLQSTTHLIGCMLLTNSGLLTQLDSSRLLRKVLSITNRKVYEEFIQQMLSYGQFDIFILPSLIDYFEKHFDRGAIELMANIIMQKFPLAFNGFDTSSNHELRPIRLKQSSTLEKIEEHLKHLEYPNVLNNEEQLLLTLIVSHLNGFREALIKQPLADICDKLVQQLTNRSSTKEVEMQEMEKSQYCLHLCCALHYQWQFTLTTDLVDAIIGYMLDDTQIDLTQIQHLDCLNQIITHNSQYIRKTHPVVIDRLAALLSHFEHKIRLLAAHSLHCLYIEQKTRTPYHVFYQAELIDINVHTYREHLLQLEKLSVDGGLFKTFLNIQYKQHTLQFLFGQLYNNFKIIWEPILKLLSDYAQHLPCEVFWTIYQRQLQITVEQIDYQEIETDLKSQTQLTTLNPLWKSKTINNLFERQYNTKQTKIQQKHLQNYRNLLWQALPQFGNIFVLKNRELISIILNFIHNEYQQLMEQRENFWDLTASNNTNNLNETQELIEEAEYEQQNHTEEFDSFSQKALEDSLNTSKPLTSALRKYRSSVGSWQTKAIMQGLETILKVLAAHNNPRALYREPELWQLYMQLLRHNNNTLQKLALDCIMSYKIKICINHKEFLYKILDDKTLKDALISFQLNEISALDQRQSFMEILLRLLYGKLFARSNTKGMNNQQRKAIILRFLGQCSIEEIEWFLEMSFGLYNTYTDINVDILQIPRMVQENFNLKAVHSPKKLQSALNLWELMRKEFIGAVQTKFHDYMLKLLVFIGALCNQALMANYSLAHTKLPLVFRNVKQNCLQALWNFCDHLQEYDWSDELVHCITEVFIFPSLSKLPQDSIHAPTILLKLLMQWSEKPKFFKFLQQQQPPKHPLIEQTNESNDLIEEKTIFHYIIDLYMNEKTKMPVRKTITNMIERLLVANENHLEHAEYGLALIKPHITRILQRLKMSFGCRPNRQNLHQQDLNILSLLTKHVETDHCDQLLQLLLPILIAKSQLPGVSSEVVVQIITTLNNLIRRLNSPEIYLGKLAPLFEQVQDVVGRKELCNLVADMARLKHKQQPDSEISANLKNTARILLLLNAYDKRWVEQPDYDKRLQALQEVKQQINSANRLDYNLGVLLIYNCYYILRYDKDMGLRDNASEHLRLLIPYLIEKYNDDQNQLNHLMENIVLAVIKRSMHSTNDNLRYESIRLLGVLARRCHTAHSVLRDLQPLTSVEDEEIDFFENITHLQLHKHGRALNRFCSLAAKFTQTPHVYTLTQIIIPLASRYLLKDQPNAKHTLIDAAIETVGIACQFLPWQHYHTVLRYYLQKLRHTPEYQKQCVRIVVRILDAFHFDLSANQTNGAVVETSTATVVSAEMEKTNASHEQINQLELMEESDMTVETALDELEANLENNKDKGDDDDDEQTENKQQADVTKPVYCLNVLLRMKPSTARHILHTIQHLLIPALNHAIIEPSTYDNQHKVNRKRLGMEREEEEILRVPIALALVKLMQKLPKSLMENSLPGVFMKVCQFLKSPLKSVRMLTRDILKKIIVCLGGEYLALLIHHLQTLLTKGFQVHVLSVTIHGVLEALRDNLQPLHIQSCMQNLLDVALNDIFGEVSAEKEIEKLTVHTPEAKPSAKSYLVLHIIARNINENCIMDLMLPFKQYLSRSKSRKLTLKIQDCFSKIVGGLVENHHIQRESLLTFTYGTISESITDLLPGVQRRKLSEQEKEQIRRARPDCFIIPPEPRMRSGYVNKQVVSSAQANAHILIEFGLELLHTVLKRKKLMDMNYVPFLNPLLPLLKDALNSSHIRVTTYALKCFASLWIEEYQLNEMKRGEFIQTVVERLFEIMHNFSKFGATKQDDNIQLTKATFKAIVALLRKCQFYTFTKEQINQLVYQVEQDLHDDGSNYAMTFNLLKAMLIRKINMKAMHGVMKQVCELSVTSQSDYIRNESRNSMLIYIMEYPLCKKVNDLINFYSVQLCYSQTAGRLSAIQLLATIIKKFPMDILNGKAEFLFLSLATRLVNDSEPECRKAVALAIELLINRSDKIMRQKLFDMSVIFIKDAYKPSVREMGAALCSRFVNAEQRSFRTRLSDIFPILVNRLQSNNPQEPGRFVKAPTTSHHNNLLPQLNKPTIPLDAGNQEQTLKSIQRSLDHEIIQLQYTLLKIFENCAEEIFQMDDITSYLDDLAYECQRQLAHDHSWVRCNAVTILAHILSRYDFAAIGRKLCFNTSLETKTNGNEEMGDNLMHKLDFIYLNPEYDIKSVVLDLCAQMIPDDISDKMINEIVKIFLYIANMLSDVPFNLKKENLKLEMEDNREEHEEDKKHVNDEITNDASGGKIHLYWLIRQLRFCINKEIAKAPHSTIIRSALFKLIEGLITLLNVNVLERLTMTFLMILVREMNEEDQNIDAELRQLAIRVGNSLRKRIGADVYDKLRTKATLKLSIRRVERKKLLAQEKINDPLRASKRKASIQLRKKSAKKLKISIKRGKTADIKNKFLKRKRKHSEHDDDKDVF